MTRVLNFASSLLAAVAALILTLGLLSATTLLADGCCCQFSYCEQQACDPNGSSHPCDEYDQVPCPANSTCGGCAEQLIDPDTEVCNCSEPTS